MSETQAFGKSWERFPDQPAHLYAVVDKTVVHGEVLSIWYSKKNAEQSCELLFEKLGRVCEVHTYLAEDGGA